MSRETMVRVWMPFVMELIGTSSAGTSCTLAGHWKVRPFPP
jgi:hypothetical protein